jgi:putative polyhydroxyalkanoate system protein
MRGASPARRVGGDSAALARIGLRGRGTRGALTATAIRRFAIIEALPGRTTMARIAIRKTHDLSHKKAKAAAQRVAEDLKKRFDLNYSWDGDRIEFERPGLSGELLIGKADVKLTCELGFLMMMLKPVIEQEVHKEFDKRFRKS